MVQNVLHQTCSHDDAISTTVGSIVLILGKVSYNKQNGSYAHIYIQQNLSIMVTLLGGHLSITASFQSKPLI